MSDVEFAELPRWARVAFAARCARRVEPLFLYLCPEHAKPYLKDDIKAIEGAICIAEKSAADARIADGARQAADAAAMVTDEHRKAAENCKRYSYDLSQNCGDDARDAAGHAFEDALHALEAGQDAAKAFDESTFEPTYAAAYKAAYIAAYEAAK